MAEVKKVIHEFPTITNPMAETLPRGPIMILGFVLSVFGLLAIGAAAFTTMITVVFLGALFLFGGIVQAGYAISYRHEQGVFLHLLGGILFAVTGLFMMFSPGISAATITLLVAVNFIVTGMYRTIVSLIHRWPSWGWSVISGLVTFGLGLLIYNAWPISSFWLIGTYFGLEVLFTGFSLIALSVALKPLQIRG